MFFTVNLFDEVKISSALVKSCILCEKIEENKTTLENCDFILCTGFFDEHEDDLDYYEKLLKNYTKSNYEKNVPAVESKKKNHSWVQIKNENQRWS